MEFWLLNRLKEKNYYKNMTKNLSISKITGIFLKYWGQWPYAVCHWWVLFNDNLFIAIVVLLHPLCHFPSIFHFLAPPQRSPQASFSLSFGPLPTVPVLHPLSQLFCASSFRRLLLHLCWSGPHWSFCTSASSLGPNLSCWAWCPWCWGCFLYLIDNFGKMI